MTVSSKVNGIKRTFHWVIYLTAATVGLESGLYTAEENDEVVEVCAISSPELDKTVTVELITQDRSAESKCFSPMYTCCL